MIKILRYLLGVLILIQLPFLYNLFQSYRLSRYLTKLTSQQVQSTPFLDLRGTIHVHSAAGGHSLGTYPEIVQAAKEAGYHYLFLTEHVREPSLFQQIEDPELVLIYGSEENVAQVGTVLTTPDSDLNIYTGSDLEQLPVRFNGFEVYNMHENALLKNTPYNWVNFIYHRVLFSNLFFFQLWEMNPDRLLQWDRFLLIRKVTGTAGNDAHQNIGIVLQTTSGQKISSVMLDPYVSSFEFVTNHVLLPPEKEVSGEAIVQALEAGSCYISFEKIADPTGFSFHAREGGQFRPMGAQVARGSQLILQSPVPVRFVLKRSGDTFQEFEGTGFSLQADEPGVYRVEVYLLDPPRLLRDKPWILSNPIFVQ